MKFIHFIYFLFSFYLLSAQIPSSSIKYESRLDDIIEDAIALPENKTLLIGHSDSFNSTSHPLIFVIDDSLNIHEYSDLYTNLAAELKMIIQFDNEIYIIALFNSSSVNDGLILLKINKDFSYSIVDSINIPIFYPSLRNYRIQDDNIYIIGDGPSKANPGYNSSFVVSINIKTNKLSYLNLTEQGYNFAFDIYPTNDSSFIISELNIQANSYSPRVKLCKYSKNLLQENCWQVPFSLAGNTKIESIDGNSITLSGSISLRVSSTLSNEQLIFSSFKFETDTLLLIDSILSGKAQKNEIPAYRGVEGAVKYNYLGGTSDYDPESFPFNTFENNYIITSFDKNLNRRFTKYIGLKNHFLFLTKSVILEDGSILLIGTAYDFTNETNERQRDIYIVKLDSLGNIATGLPPELLAENDFLLYPNPGSDYLQVSLPNASSGRFALYDMQGRFIEWQLFRQHLQINTAGLPAGIYIYRISDEKERTHYGKWVKQ